MNVRQYVHDVHTYEYELLAVQNAERPHSHAGSKRVFLFFPAFLRVIRLRHYTCSLLSQKSANTNKELRYEARR